MEIEKGREKCFYNIKRKNTKTIFFEGEEDGHLKRRETLQIGLKEMYLFYPEADQGEKQSA